MSSTRICEGYYQGPVSSLSGSTFRNNRSVRGGDLYGPLTPVADCTFSGNTARYGAVLDELRRLLVTVNGIPDLLGRNPNMKNALTNKINAGVRLVEQGSSAQAVDKIENDIRAKTDGCATIGEPDSNDWIEDCGAQAEVYG